jgi:hypothetical protein
MRPAPFRRSNGRVQRIDEKTAVIELEHSGTLEIYKEQGVSIEIKSADSRTLDAVQDPESEAIVRVPVTGAVSIVLSWVLFSFLMQ